MAVLLSLTTAASAEATESRIQTVTIQGPMTCGLNIAFQFALQLK